MDDEAGGLGVRDEALDQGLGHRRSRYRRRASAGSSRPRVQARPGPKRPPRGCPSGAKNVEARYSEGRDQASDQSVKPSRSRGRRDPLLDQVLAELEQQLVQRDLHRAGDSTGAAEGGGVRQGRRTVEPDEQGHEHSRHRAGVNRSVRASARLAVDRADVEAGSAADAGEHLLVAAAAEVGATVVENDHVQLLGPVDLSHAPGSREESRVTRSAFDPWRCAGGAGGARRGRRGSARGAPCRAARCGPRQGRHQAAVALVRDETEGAGARDARSWRR